MAGRNTSALRGEVSRSEREEFVATESRGGPCGERSSRGCARRACRQAEVGRTDD